MPPFYLRVKKHPRWGMLRRSGGALGDAAKGDREAPAIVQQATVGDGVEVDADAGGSVPHLIEQVAGEGLAIDGQSGGSEQVLGVFEIGSQPGKAEVYETHGPPGGMGLAIVAEGDVMQGVRAHSGASC